MKIFKMLRILLMPGSEIHRIGKENIKNEDFGKPMF